VRNDPQLRRGLIGDGYERSVAVYRRARELGCRDPVVLILDLRDPVAKKAARLVGEEGDIKEALYESNFNGKVPTMIVAAGREGAARLLSNFSPSARKALARGGPSLVCVAAGGTAYALMEVDP
jgi:hypothetical protein